MYCFLLHLFEWKFIALFNDGGSNFNTISFCNYLINVASNILKPDPIIRLTDEAVLTVWNRLMFFSGGKHIDIDKLFQLLTRSTRANAGNHACRWSIVVLSHHPSKFTPKFTSQTQFLSITLWTNCQ